jgi:ligand-binding SRPBCC domain-containing protein
MNPQNLIEILPSYLRIEIVEAPSELLQNSRLACVMYIGPLRFDWHLEVSEHQPPFRFVDFQKEGPFRKYKHTHLFQAEKDGTRLTDVIEYELPLPFSGLASRIGFQNHLKEVLTHGQRTTRSLIEQKGG